MSGDERGAYLAFLVVSQLALLGGLTLLLALLSLLWAAAGGLDWSAVPAVVAALFYANLILFQALLRRQFYIEGQPAKALVQSIANLLLVILGLLGFWYWGGADLVSIYMMLAFAGIIVCVVQAWRLFHRLRRPTRPQRHTFARETWSYARWNVLSVPIAQVSISGVTPLRDVGRRGTMCRWGRRTRSCARNGWTKDAPFWVLVSGLALSGQIHPFLLARRNRQDDDRFGARRRAAASALQGAVRSAIQQVLRRNGGKLRLLFDQIA